MQADFRLRPKVLTPYSWEFIEEKWLYNWVNADSNISNKELVLESLKFIGMERPQAPPLQVVIKILSSLKRNSGLQDAIREKIS